MKIYLSHAGSFAYETELYAPIKESELYRQHAIFLPHEPAHIDIKAADIIDGFDLMVGEVSYPSTGQGIELGLAAAAQVPIICFYKAGSTPSSSLRFYCQELISYTDTADLLDRLAENLATRSHLAPTAVTEG